MATPIYKSTGHWPVDLGKMQNKEMKLLGIKVVDGKTVATYANECNLWEVTEGAHTLRCLCP